MRRSLWAVLLAGALACGGPHGPATLDVHNEACRWCRMAVSQQALASQLGAPMEEPLFFDDLGCLRDYLAAHTPSSDLQAWVADHRTGEWVPAAAAVYTRVEGLATPMSSHLIAHADAVSRDADPLAAGGALVEPSAIFGSQGPPGAVP